MKVFIDGEEVECNSDIKVIYHNEIIDFRGTKETAGDLVITLTSEGMIADTFEKTGPFKVANETYKSMWKDLADIIEETH